MSEMSTQVVMPLTSYKTPFMYSYEIPLLSLIRWTSFPLIWSTLFVNSFYDSAVLIRFGNNDVSDMYVMGLV